MVSNGHVSHALSVSGGLPVLGSPSLQALMGLPFWSWVLGTGRTRTREQWCPGGQGAGEEHLAR